MTDPRDDTSEPVRPGASAGTAGPLVCTRPRRAGGKARTGRRPGDRAPDQTRPHGCSDAPDDHLEHTEKTE